MEPGSIKPAVDIPIDPIDSRIISILQKDGRIPNIEIAKQLDISEATVRSRIRRLIDNEVIQIVAVSNPHKLGFHMTGDLYIHVDMKKIDSVLEKLAEMNELWYIIMTTGEASINAEYVVRSREELNDLVYNRISSIDGVLRIEISVIMRYVKRRYDYGTGYE